MHKNQKKNIFLIVFTTVFLLAGYSQNQEVIILPDISTELSSGNFVFDEDAIPGFSVEPLKNVSEKKVEVVEEKPIIKVEEQPEIVIEEVIEPISESKKNIHYLVGGTFGYSSQMFEIAPKVGIEYFGDGYSLTGDLDISMGSFAFEKGEKKRFFALESLGFMAKFELPKNFELGTKLGLEFFQSKNPEKSFDFAVPLAVNLQYNGFAPLGIYGELGQKTFRPFENSFYGSIGGIYKFYKFVNKTELQFGKQIGIVNTLSFSTNPEKYEVAFVFDYYIKKTPYFALSGVYKF